MPASPARVTTIDVLKALADPTRLRVVSLVAEAGELCACEIESLLGVNQSNLSRHLTRLQNARVLEGEKRGTWVHYRPAVGSDDDGLVATVVRCARADTSTLGTDLARLAEYRASNGSCRTILRWTDGSRPS